MAQTGLGKGLSALISSDMGDGSSGGFLPELAISKIIPNRYQPRMNMKNEELNELVSSIKAMGVIEPLIVTKVENEDKYELIAGERRLEASKKAGLKTIPAVLKEASPQQMLELAVVENVQRADLNPLEEGLAYEQLVTEFNMSHQDISDKVGLSRPAIANKIRLLKLPEKVKEGLLDSKIDEGHARALLGLTSDEVILEAYKKIVSQNLSVRGVEELVRRLNQGHKPPRRSNQRLLDNKTISIENSLKEKLTEKVRLSRSKKGGKIVISFSNDKELDDIYKKLLG
ncbi:MAG TPA: ParB/RepB/Spo0J family partition protein [Candidatus Dojkabacteria bacterium]|jgi:ParB family chromosome partitioning protein